MSPGYVHEFLSLRRSAEILMVVNPLFAPEKEITESMAILKLLRPIALTQPMRYKVVDLCAGNALTSVTSVFTLPVKEAIAVDKRTRKRPWSTVKRFQYLNCDIYNESLEELLDSDTLITAIHPCGELAVRIIDLFNRSEAKALFLMPCCKGRTIDARYETARKQLGGYSVWVHTLSARLEGGQFLVDPQVLSPCNAIVYSTSRILS